MDERLSQEYLAFACKGDASAMQFLELITTVLHFWDDLVDQDHVLSQDTINAVMWKVLVDLPRNKFYANNFFGLNTLLINSIGNWKLATKVEQSGDATQDELAMAFIIRSSYCDLVVHTALLCGGQQHADACAEHVRRVFHSEGLEGYKSALITEREARDGLQSLRK